MQYLMTFFEGIVSFISPCMLPLLPIYVSYFAGQANKKAKTLCNAMCFVGGFTLVFCLLGLFAGGIGELLHEYHDIIDIVCGIIIIFLGLNFLEVIKLPFLHGFHTSVKISGKLSAMFFGVVFSISHAPCMSAWLGTALVTASASGAAMQGVLLLFSYSVGLAVPFLVSAVLIDRMSGLFAKINKNRKIINLVCGIALILVGLCMSTGILHELMHIAS